ncbi:MAG: type II toxin-antitoxin system HicB family antitoxin [Clostridia bacterium]|nr:type II toxin-antitoxin system HicB family antitoxin [Clostridia bacterium]
MLSIYPACFIREQSAYSVIFPDLDGLATCGETLEEAMAMAVDCLAGYLHTLAQEGKPAPTPSALSGVDPRLVVEELELDDASDAFVNLVSVDVPSYAKAHFERSVKKTLSIPEWLNNAALEKGLNFSQILQDALKQRIQNA